MATGLGIILIVILISLSIMSVYTKFTSTTLFNNNMRVEALRNTLKEIGVDVNELILNKDTGTMTYKDVIEIEMQKGDMVFLYCEKFEYMIATKNLATASAFIKHYLDIKKEEVNEV